MQNKAPKFSADVDWGSIHWFRKSYIYYSCYILLCKGLLKYLKTIDL